MLGKKSTKTRESGFTLIEIAIVVTMVGLAAFGIVNAYTSLSTKIQKGRTEINLGLIQDALGAYAERNYRLPCPMNGAFTGAPEPFGYEAGSGINGGTIPNDCPLFEGVVPFKTLGLKLEDAKDGYGQFFTYRIGRSTARDPSLVANVHENCRGVLWMRNLMNGAGTANINPGLASFCCRAADVGANDELNIQYRPAAAAATENAYPWVVDNGGGRYGAINTPAPANFASNANNRNTIRPVYVLVSHGEKGIGAFEAGGSGVRVAGFASIDENQNRTTASPTFVTKEWYLRLNNANFFDDTVAWGTQESLLARSGHFSCHAPRP